MKQTTFKVPELKNEEIKDYLKDSTERKDPVFLGVHFPPSFWASI